MRNLIFPAAFVASLMLGSAALAADPQAGTPDSGTTAAAPVVQYDVIGGTLGAPLQKATVSRQVSYAGLNLANPADIKILDQRIRSAAVEDCTQLRDQTDVPNPDIVGGRCVRAAVHAANASIRPAELAATALQ